MGSGRLLSYQPDVSDSILSNRNSPSESFRVPQWTPLAQDATVSDFVAAASESSSKASAMTSNTQGCSQTGFVLAPNVSESSSSGYSRGKGPMAASTHGSMLQRNFSGTYSSLSKLGSRRRFCRQKSDSHACLKNMCPKNAGGIRQQIVLEGGQCSKGTSRQQADGTDWSMQALSQLMASWRREGVSCADANYVREPSWNVNEDSLSYGSPPLVERIKVVSSQAVVSDLGSIDSQGDLNKCGLCSRWLLHRSPWSSHRMLGGNDLPVVGVLVCGHVYHADCLEKAVPDTHKHDPPCPLCSEPENIKLKELVQCGFDGAKGTGETFKSKLSRIGPQFQRKSSMNAKLSLSVDSDGRKGTPISTPERGFFPRSFSRRQFAFRGKSTKDSTAQTSCSRKTGSSAQVSPENQN